MESTGLVGGGGGSSGDSARAISDATVMVGSVAGRGAGCTFRIGGVQGRTVSILLVEFESPTTELDSAVLEPSRLQLKLVESESGVASSHDSAKSGFRGGGMSLLLPIISALALATLVFLRAGLVGRHDPRVRDNC